MSSTNTTTSPSGSAMESNIETPITSILSLYDRLRAHRGDFTPSPEISELFSQLMTICLAPIPTAHSSTILSDPRIQKLLPGLHTLCCVSESELEQYWSCRISAAIDPKSELQAFPYYQNYIDLTRLEISAISAIDTRPIKNIAFIGSGPLPLSSLCLIDQLNIFSETKQRSNLGLLGWIQNFLGFGTKQGIRVVNIDHCPAAIEMSTALCNSLGPSAHGIEHSVSDAISSYDLRDFDVIFLAALVGANQAEKEEILRSVTARMREGALVVIRSVNGMRELCYPVFEGGSEGVGEYIEVGVTVHPGGEVVNSVVVGRVKAFGGRK